MAPLAILPVTDICHRTVGDRARAGALEYTSARSDFALTSYAGINRGERQRGETTELPKNE